MVAPTLQTTKLTANFSGVLRSLTRIFLATAGSFREFQAPNHENHGFSAENRFSPLIWILYSAYYAKFCQFIGLGD